MADDGLGTVRPPSTPSPAAFLAAGATGFAVIDLETTGLSPRADRIVELAVVHLDAQGVETGRWETVLNPGRDLGPQRIHGIRAADALAAPAFPDIVTELVRLLDGRVPVAHNAAFDSQFLFAEFERAGIGVWARPDFLCTMQLASRFLPGAGRSLSGCCAAYDIPRAEQHRASADALAAARLLSAYLADARRDPELAAPFVGLAAARWPTPVTSGRPIPWRARTVGAAPLTASGFLARLSDRMPPVVAGDAQAEEYLAVLDRALIDRALSVHESEALLACAERLGLDRTAVADLHEDYFDALTRIAWADGILTEEEIDEVLAVAELLGLPTPVIERALDPQRAARVMFEPRPSTRVPRGFALRRGDVVVLTGEMVRPRAAWEAELAAAGLVPAVAVTRRTTLVVAADPDTLSGKARTARDYGVPIVAEAALSALLAPLVSPAE